MVQVHFPYCVDLPKRQYDLTNGMLFINCTEWKTIVLSLYKSFLHVALSEIRFIPKPNDAFKDERITSILSLAQDLFFKNTSVRSNRKCSSLEMRHFKEESGNFPLSMKNLYNNLLKSNRLSHNARFDISLYLKEIGLQRTDSFEFWKKFYSKQHSSC
ncbi:probable DNA primase large subunit [Sitophilus oryzae]|uniref:Probable DNA primase large subunit n=1 Tax=Sitophilus oryzae TaxID=7048 RepID=A0A6J2YS88_SITOR|nr:probable DNA primase large subunit [Sitophilus oryzae]